MEINNKTAPVTGQQDQNTISLDLMGRMKLHGMAEAFRESLAGTTPQSMTADTFLSMLLAREWDYRAQAAIVRLTRNAAFRYKAYLEQIDYATNRGLERNQMERLATLDFVHKGQNLFITGSSGTGKSYIACALGHEACKSLRPEERDAGEVEVFMNGRRRGYAPLYPLSIIIALSYQLDSTEVRLFRKHICQELQRPAPVMEQTYLHCNGSIN